MPARAVYEGRGGMQARWRGRGPVAWYAGPGGWWYAWVGICMVAVMSGSGLMRAPVAVCRVPVAVCIPGGGGGQKPGGRR